MNFYDAVKRWWAEASAIARAGVVLGTLAVLISTAFLFQGASNQRPIPLFVGMSQTDAANLALELDKRNIAYALQDNGTTIAVKLPREEMRKLRLQLTSDGIPTGPVTGFEIFDDTSVTLTEFERKVMYQRALQGELSRTIAELPQVSTARVHLALPSKSLLERQTGQPTASVYISLTRGRTIDERIASGIANLVASSVPELSADKIAIMDGQGTMIREPDEGSGSGRKALALKEGRERELEKDIVDLLERTVGQGHVIAKVSVDMDMTRIEETLEQYDPDNSALRTERKTTEETSSERTQPASVAGVQSNLPQVPPNPLPNGPGSKSNSNRSIDTKEFAVPRTVRQVSRPLGQLRKLSIAVLVDTNPFKPLPPEPETKEGEDGALEVPDDGVEGGRRIIRAEPPPQPSPELLAALIKSAVGFDAARGDNIEISFVPFVIPDTVGGDEVQYIESPVEPWLWLLLTFLLGIAMVAGSMWATERKRKAHAIAEYARKLEEKELLLQKAQEEEDSGIPDPTRLRQDVRDLTTKNVAATVEVMKGWLRPTLGKS